MDLRITLEFIDGERTIKRGMLADKIESQDPMTQGEKAGEIIGETIAYELAAIGEIVE